MSVPDANSEEYQRDARSWWAEQDARRANGRVNGTPPPAAAPPDDGAPHPAEQDGTAPGGDDGDTGRRAAVTADLLLGLAARRGSVWFHTPAGEAYAVLPVAGHRETWALRSRVVKRWLSRLAYQETGRAPKGEAVTEALAVLEARALFDGPEHPVHVRIAGQDDRVYLDLADAAWRVVEVDATGWRILDAPPVRFRRARGMLALPAPQTGGTVDDLRPYVNVASEDDWRLVVAWLLGTFSPRGPYPILGLYGQHGSAKSTLARLLRSLIDPNKVALRTPPKDARDLMIAATNAWTVALDNVSHIPEWLSDALCSLATGGGFATRELYSDDEESLFEAQRPLVITGIPDLLTRGDLADRAIPQALPVVEETARLTERELWAAVDPLRPRVLGALLDAVAGALAALPATRLKRLPRMADFAVWVSAAETTLGWPKGAFMDAYAVNRAEANATVLEASPIARYLDQLLDRHARQHPVLPEQPPAPWEGTATELLDALVDVAGLRPPAKPPSGWPGSPRSLSAQLRRLAPNLRQAGIAVTHSRQGSGARRIGKVTLARSSVSSVSSGSPDAPPPGGPGLGETQRGRRETQPPRGETQVGATPPPGRDARDARDAPSRTSAGAADVLDGTCRYGHRTADIDAWGQPRCADPQCPDAADGLWPTDVVAPAGTDATGREGTR